MNNYYLESDYKYNEIAIALEDFIYDNLVPISIPSVMALLNKETPITTNNRLYGYNLQNKDKSRFNLPMNVVISNHVNIVIPSNFAVSSEWDRDRDCYIGRRGTQFIITFVGGNSNKYRIIGRY